jgi:hypothetical protein
MFAKFILIIFVSNGFGGEDAVQIPMSTIDLCQQARKDYADGRAHNYTDPEYALGKTMCIRVE